MMQTNGFINWKNFIAILSIISVILIAILTYFQGRINVSEATQSNQQASIAVLAEQNKQVTDRLTRIENKLDRALNAY